MKAVKDTVELWSSASDRGSNISLTRPIQNKDMVAVKQQGVGPAHY